MSKYIHISLLTALCSIGLTAGSSLRAADAITGQWTVSGTNTAGQAHLTMMRATAERSFSTSSDWSLADLRGLDLSTPARHDVRFTIERDAGRFDADGFAGGAQGAGLFTFTPSPAYAGAMAALGFSGANEDRQLSLALHDVSRAFAQEMKDAGIENLTLDRLLAFRIHHVDLAYIHALRAEGLKTTDADRLIALRIHNVTPEFAKSLRVLGFTPDDHQLIALRIHQVTPEYIAGLKSHGLQNLTIDKVIRLKIHGIA